MKNTILSLLSIFFIFNINSQGTYDPSTESYSYDILAGSYYYTPSNLTVSVGDVVNWYNEGGWHNVNFNINTQTGESFGNPESFSSSPTTEVGALIYSHVFNIPGTYTYDCSIGSHAANGMVGTIVVECSEVDECGVCGGSGPNEGFDCDGNPTASAANLFFSEYSEGSGNHKYLEIYNASDETVDLSMYAYPNVTNAPSTAGDYEYWNTFDAGASIAPGDVYVIAHGSSDDTILAEADELHNYLSNGDDGYALVFGTEDDYIVLDWLGDFEGDPGSEWSVADGGTKDHTLVRKCGIIQGNTDWAASAGTNVEDSEWIVYPQNTWDYVGFHEVVCSADPCENVTCAEGEICEEGTCISTYSLTVSVDMTLEGFDGDAMDVRLDGGDWMTMTDMGDGVWSYTFNGLVAGSYEYNFNNGVDNGYEDGCDANGSDADTCPDLSSCATGSWGNNRTATIVDSDVVVGTVCWESCEACPADPCANVTCEDGAICEEGVCLPTYSLTVSVDMSIEGFDGDAMDVKLVGEEWNEMIDMGDGVWSYTFTGMTAGDYAYNFNDGGYESSSNLDACATGYWGNNRTATIVDSDVIVDTVCWESCDACQCEDLDGDSICDNVDDCVGSPDCLGVCNGSAVIDACGVCDGDESSCAGCDGVANSGLTVDECGVCGGNNSTCSDCAGTPNGSAIIDECGVCNGNGPDEGFDCQGNPLPITQSIELPEGWSLWSTYIDVSNSSMEELMSDVVDNVTIIKNSNGNVYWPEFELNNINSIQVGEGFQAKMTTSENLYVTGNAVSMDTQFTVPGGWSIIGYLSENSMLPQTAMSDGWVQISSENLVILKDEVGNVYWPEFGLNNIGYMQPGEAYQIKTNAAASFSYTYGDNARFAEPTQIGKNVFYDNPKNTGNNMIVGIPNNAWEIMPSVGDEISAFDESGMLIGSSKYAGDNIALTLWGDDLTTNVKDGLSIGEKVTFKLWNSDMNTESTIVVTKWDAGSDTYTIDGISIASNIIFSAISSADTYKLYQNVPNPFNGTTIVNFYVPENSKVNIGVYNMLGEHVAEITNNIFNAGKHEIVFNSNNLGQGTYFVRMNTDNFTSTKQMNLVK